jgi:hypothetical protein
MEHHFDTPIPDKDNFVKYFIENDSTLNIQSELIFSVLGRYNCFAGCKVCYTQKHFNQALPDFFNYVPINISTSMESKWFEIFDHFSTVSNIDDIFWLKHERPQVYEWYKQNSRRFVWGNMTDNNFIRTQPIFVNELSPDTRIQEISFSEEWLERLDPDEIIKMLDVLNNRNGVNKIKFIFQSSDQDNMAQGTAKIWNWVQDRAIQAYCSHHDFRGLTTKLNTVIPQAEHIASDRCDIYTVCRESNYLMYDNFFLTLIESIGIENKPYYTFKNFDLEKHLSNMLIGKLDLYRSWVEKYDQGNVLTNSLSNIYFDYFRWVRDNVKINPNYNFIPIDFLNARHRYYHKLVNSGWSITDYGLFKQGTNTVVPLIEIKNG